MIPNDRATWPPEAVEMVESCGYSEGTLYLGQCKWPQDSHDDAPFRVPKKTKSQPQYYARARARDVKRNIVIFFALPCESFIRHGSYMALGKMSTDFDLGIDPNTTEK